MSSADKGGGGSSDADVHTFWCKNLSMVCPHGQGELSQYGHFSNKGEGSIFRDFVWTSFTDDPLLLTYLHIQKRNGLFSANLSNLKKSFKRLWLAGKKSLLFQACKQAIFDAKSVMHARCAALPALNGYLQNAKKALPPLQF